MIRYKTKEEAIAVKKSGDRLFCDPYTSEYFIISPRKYIWKEGEFEENFIIMPETFEECAKLRYDNCQDCAHLPHRMGTQKSCRKRSLLLNRASMEIYD